MVCELHETLTLEQKLHAYVTVPSDFNPEKEMLPMIVFLHGAGERGADLSILRLHGIPKYFTKDPDYLGLRVITLSPQCPDGTLWTNHSAAVFGLIQKVAKEYHADPNAISITGLSMGGFGTWEMLLLHPDFFSAAAPICGGGIDGLIPANLKTPVRAFHGDADTLVPLCYSENLCKAVNNRGGHAELTVYPNVGHNSWTPAYEQTDLIHWLATARKN